MSIFGKPLEQVTQSDLQIIIDKNIPENANLEYKRESYKDNDGGKKEFLKDVSAFANAMGGVLLIGIEERQDRPTKIVGIEHAREEAGAARQLCNACIQERIQGLKVESIKIGKDRSVLAIEVPPSIRQPHMVTLGRHRSFWKRQGNQNVPMNMDDIRYAIIRGHEGMEKSKLILNNAIENIKSFINDNQIVLILILPNFTRDNLIDTTQAGIREAATDFPDLPFCHWREKPFRGHIRPFMDGIEAYDRYPTNYIQSRCRIYDNGLYEYFYLDDSTEDKRDFSINLPFLCDHFLYSLETCRNIYAHAGISGPFSVKVCTLGSSPPTFFVNTSRFRPNIITNPFKENIILFREMTFPDIDNIQSVGKAYSDLIWRSLHYERCLYFSEEGKYIFGQTENQ